MSEAGTLSLRVAAATHPGKVRANNEDSFLAEQGIYVVADGMGGHQGGEVASRLAVESLANGRGRLTDLGSITTLVGEANATILARADAEPEYRGMGTTLTGVVVVGDPEQPLERVAVVNVGDSRTYRWRSGQLEQITRDHSYVQDLVASGMLTAAEARHHPRRNIVTRALGVESVVVPDVLDIELLSGDRFIVCSDGLVDEVPDVDIADVLSYTSDPDELANRLLQMALDFGGRDNVTVLIVDVVQTPEVSPDITPQLPVEPAVVAAPVTTTVPAVATVARRSTTRRWLGVALFVVALVVVIGGTFVAVAAYARSGYFVDFDEQDDLVVVYQGRPGGVLWFDPTTVEVTDLRREALGPVDIERINSRPTFGARGDVTLYLSTVTTTTTVPTTVPSTVPTTVPTTTIPDASKTPTPTTTAR